MPRTSKNPEFPGHVGVSWKDGGSRTYRGFRFQITDLPEEYQAASRWRDYLFDHRVPGYVENDLMLLDAHRRRPADLLCRDWPAAEERLEAIKKESATGRSGFYSFNPRPEKNTHNCVTWAFSTLNRVLGEMLPSVRDGRMKVAVEVLQAHGAKASI